MPDSQERNLPLDGSFSTPTSGVNRSFYGPVTETELPNSEVVRGAPAAPWAAPQIARPQNPSGVPELPRRPTEGLHIGSRHVPKAPATKQDTVADDYDEEDATDDDSDDDTDVPRRAPAPRAPRAPAAPKAIGPIRRPVGPNARFNACLKRWQFPVEANHLVVVTIQVDASPFKGPAAFHSKAWTFKVQRQSSEENEKFKRIFIDWAEMMLELGVEVGDAVTMSQVTAAGNGDIVFNVIIEKGGGAEELLACNREKDGRCKRGAAAVAAADDDQRQGQAQKRARSATTTPGKTPPPARQPSAPHTGAVSPAARLQDLNFCLEIMARRGVDIKSQAKFQLAFLKADAGVAAHARRSLAVANQGGPDNTLVQQTLELLLMHMG